MSRHEAALSHEVHRYDKNSVASAVSSGRNLSADISYIFYQLQEVQCNACDLRNGSATVIEYSHRAPLYVHT